MKARDQIILNPDDLPGSWYNVLADLPGEFPKPKDPEDGAVKTRISLESSSETLSTTRGFHGASVVGGAGGGIRTHEGLRHRISPASRILSQAPFDPANGPAPLT